MERMENFWPIGFHIDQTLPHSLGHFVPTLKKIFVTILFQVKCGTIRGFFKFIIILSIKSK